MQRRGHIARQRLAVDIASTASPPIVTSNVPGALPVKVICASVPEPLTAARVPEVRSHRVAANEHVFGVVVQSASQSGGTYVRRRVKEAVDEHSLGRGLRRIVATVNW